MDGWIEDLITGWGAIGVGLLMFLETVFPPIPSEVVLPLAGFQAAEGPLNPVATFVAAVVGAMAGVWIWYEVGRWIGLERTKAWAARYGRLLTLTPQEIDRVDAWFERYGGWAVFFGRMVPGIRTLISVPAGVAEMGRLPFLVMSTLGTTLWSAILFGAGYWLGEEFASVGDALGPVSNVLIGAAVIYYVYRVVTFDPDRSAA